MTMTTLPPPARRGKRGILSDEFRHKLGDVSKSTFHRLSQEDPRFPESGWIRNQRIWDEDMADDYVALLVRDTDRQEAAVPNGAPPRHTVAADPEGERKLAPRRDRPTTKRRRKEAAAIGVD
jgi:hypothetical protein